MSTNSKNFSNSFSLTDEIADVVRERILKGEYEIGEKIKENQIFKLGNSAHFNGKMQMSGLTGITPLIRISALGASILPPPVPAPYLSERLSTHIKSVPTASSIFCFSSIFSPKIFPNY